MVDIPGLVGGEVYFERPIDLFPSHLVHTFATQFEGMKPEKHPVDFSIMDIRIGRIMTVMKNPHSPKTLVKSYICRVEIGWERCPRFIAAELAPYYTREQLKLRKVVVLCNIPPERTFGQRSWGWILAADTPDGDIELLEPPPNSNEIDQVTVWGFPPVLNLREQPDLNVKQLKKLFKDLRISPEGVAEWQGYPMCVEDGTVPIRAGRYARDTPIVKAVKNRSWKKYKYKSPAQLRKELREYIP